MIEVTLRIHDPGDEFQDNDIVEWLKYVFNYCGSMREEIGLDESSVDTVSISIERDGRYLR